MEIDLKQLKELMRSLKQFDITELEIEKDGERVRLRRGGDGAAMVAPILAQSIAAPAMAASGSIPPPPPTPVEAAPAKSSPQSDPNVVTITSPFVGTFYRAPSPDQPSFVDVGSDIRPGQVLCIVEAMKLMNEIESEIAGTIVEVTAQNGKPVEYGDVLFRVKKPG
jgi:acetyl-CoA carboxylase biotin carboxyl carrier protein